MNLAGSYTLNAPLERVFDLMTDPEVVAACLPGCEKLEALGDNRYRAELKMGVAAITGRYEATVELRDLQRPQSYRLVVEGKGKPGFVKGSAELRLRPARDGTQVDLTGEAQAGGAIARVGQRLMGAASKKLMDEFFSRLEGELAR